MHKKHPQFQNKKKKSTLSLELKSCFCCWLLCTTVLTEIKHCFKKKKVYFQHANYYYYFFSDWLKIWLVKYGMCFQLSLINGFFSLWIGILEFWKLVCLSTCYEHYHKTTFKKHIPWFATFQILHMCIDIKRQQWPMKVHETGTTSFESYWSILTALRRLCASYEKLSPSKEPKWWPGE